MSSKPSLEKTEIELLITVIQVSLGEALITKPEWTKLLQGIEKKLRASLK